MLVNKPCSNCGKMIAVRDTDDLMRCPRCSTQLEVYITVSIRVTDGVTTRMQPKPNDVFLQPIASQGGPFFEDAHAHRIPATLRSSREGVLDLQTLSSPNFPTSNGEVKLGMPRITWPGDAPPTGWPAGLPAATPNATSPDGVTPGGNGFGLILGIVLLVLAIAAAPELAAALDTFLGVVP